jgi:hypothetical protein
MLNRTRMKTRTAPQSDIDKSLEADTKIKQYRDRVREFLSDRKLSTLEMIRLERLRKDLGLSEPEANRILMEQQEPIRKAQDEYGAMLLGLIEAGHYPLDATIQAELLAVQQELGLNDEEVATISTPILAAAEEDYRARLAQEKQQEYEQKLKRYEQEFSQKIRAQYPIEKAVRTGLISFQQMLGLHDQDVACIEQLLIVPREAEYQRQQEEQRQQAQQRALEQQRELEQQQKLEQQRQLEENRKREDAKQRLPLKSFEFQVPTVNIVENSVDKVVETPGWFGKKTEVVKTIEKTCNVTYQRGQADYFVEDLGNGGDSGNGYHRWWNVHDGPNKQRKAAASSGKLVKQIIKVVRARVTSTQSCRFTLFHGQVCRDSSTVASGCRVAESQSRP